MKKTSRFALFALSSLMMTGSFYACNDYDGDINSLNDRIDGIVNGSTDVTSSQTLLAELAKLKQELLEEVASKYATVAALSNYATKAELESALAKAKTELIAEINKCTTMDAVKSYISGLGYLTETQINNLLQAYATPREIADALKNYSTTTEVNALIAGCEKKGDIQAALKDYSKTTEISALMTAYAKKSDIESSVEDAKSDLLKKIQACTDMESVKTYVSGLNYMSKAEINALLTSYVTPADIAKDLADYCKTTEVDAKIAEQAKTLTDAQTELIQTLIDNNLKDYETVAKFNVSMAAAKASLNARIDSASAANMKAMSDSLNSHRTRIASLESTVRGFEKNMSDAAETAVSKALKSFVGEYTGTLSDVDKNIKDLTKRVESLTLAVDQLLKRIQSIVFVPEFGNQWSGATYVPVYKNTFSAVAPQSILKFRVSPAESANAIVKLFEANPDDITLDMQNAIKTRVLTTSSAEIDSVKAMGAGIINVYSKMPNTLTANSLNPVSLVITNDNDSADHISSGYFNLYADNYSILDIDLFTATTTDRFLPVSYLEGSKNSIDNVTLYDQKNDEVISIANGYSYDPELRVFGGYIGGVVKRASNNTEWTAFKDAANVLGFVVENNGVVKAVSPSDIGNVGKSITLRVYDANFGLTTGANPVPNRAYDLTFKITKSGVVDPKYNFGNIDLVWGSSHKNKAGVNTQFNGQAFSVYTDQAQAAHFDIDSISISSLKDAKGIDAASAADVITEINGLTKVLTIKDKDGKTVDNFGATLIIEPNTKKAALTIDVPAKVLYQTYFVTLTCDTKWGNVSFSAKLNLSYPTDLLAHEPRFSNGREGDFIVEAGNQVESPAHLNVGLVQSSLKLAYLNYADYKDKGVDYKFTPVSDTYKTAGKASQTPTNFFIDPTDFSLVLSATPHVFDYTSNKYIDATGFVKVKCSVTIDSFQVASEEFNILAKYPLDGQFITSNAQIIESSSLINNQTASVIGNVSLNDRYGNKLFEKGELVHKTPSTFNATVWGIEKLTYALESAKTSDGLVVNSVSVSDKGDLSITNANLTQDVIVTVKVTTVGYKYDQVTGYFNVTVKAQQ